MAPKFACVSAPFTVLERQIFLFNISAALRNVVNPSKEQIYGATQAAWIVGEQWRQAQDGFAVSLIDGISFGVYAIEDWYAEGKRWAFTAGDLDSEAIDALNWKNFRSLTERLGN